MKDGKRKARYGEYVYQHPIPHVEVGPLARLINQPKKTSNSSKTKKKEKRDY